jgi:PAS domain S-box-containing protein
MGASGDTPERFEKLYTMLLDSMPASILLIDQAYRVESANRNFLIKSRLSANQVLGQPIDKVFPLPIAKHMNLRARLAEVFRTGEACKGQRLHYRAPGLATRTYYYSLLPFNWRGQVENVILFMEDITEMVRLGEEVRRAEGHLAGVVEAASDLVVSMDLAGRVLTWNTAAVRVTGYEESEVSGRPLTELIAESYHAMFDEFLDRVRQANPADPSASLEPMEVELVGRDGQLLPISWLCSCMRDSDGRSTGLVAVGRDLTERRKFEARLMQSEKLAALGVMAGGIAHEIRNPLAVVSSAAQLLLTGKLTPELQQECAQKIHSGVQRAASVIEGLLRFARPADRGVKERLDLCEVAREAAKLTASQMKIARAEFVAQLSASPVWVLGNANLLQQLLTNLMLNAANAMPPTGGSICLSVTQRANECLVQVSDTGQGISPQNLPRVFDPFFTTMPVGKGTGLGLSICYAIAQDHGGRIDIASEPGRGTTVTVSFPAAEPTA